MFPLRSHAQMEESGILLFMLVNARQEPIQETQTVNLCLIVAMEKFIILSTISAIAHSAWSREAINVWILLARMVNIGMDMSAQLSTVLPLPSSMLIAVFIEETVNVLLDIFGTVKNASFIQFSAQPELPGADQVALPTVNAEMGTISALLVNAQVSHNNALLLLHGMVKCVLDPITLALQELTRTITSASLMFHAKTDSSGTLLI